MQFNSLWWSFKANVDWFCSSLIFTFDIFYPNIDERFHRGCQVCDSCQCQLAVYLIVNARGSHGPLVYVQRFFGSWTNNLHELWRTKNEELVGSKGVQATGTRNLASLSCHLEKFKTTNGSISDCRWKNAIYFKLNTFSTHLNRVKSLCYFLNVKSFIFLYSQWICRLKKR